MLERIIPTDNSKHQPNYEAQRNVSDHIHRYHFHDHANGITFPVMMHSCETIFLNSGFGKVKPMVNSKTS